MTLRHSSIRPDLPHLLKGIVEKELDVFDHLMMTTDGSTPLLVDRNGKWRVNTMLKVFASSYSNTGDIILIGKKKK